MQVYGETETNTYYYLKDHLGSVIGITDESGSIVESYAYDAWGNVTVYNATGTEISESAIGNRYTFQGREISWASGLYYFRARWYDASVGRFLSKDPIGISGGLNLYSFCADDPVNNIDPFGLCENEGGYLGGWWNPGNWRRGLYTGDPRASDSIYQNAVDAAGEYLFNTYPGGGFAIGSSFQGGGAVGGQTGGGIVFAFNWADIIQIGGYGMGGFGSYVGAGGSATIDLSIHPYTDIGQFQGEALTIGGSGGAAGVTAGGEAVIPLNADDGYLTLSLGLGGGTPVEGHAFYTGTSVTRFFR